MLDNKDMAALYIYLSIAVACVAMNTLAALTSVKISSNDFKQMLKFAQTMLRLYETEGYARMMQDSLPETAYCMRHRPAVLLGFDFHLSETGPKLIEINNNAGGLFVGDAGWLQQPEIDALPGYLEERLQAMFPDSWQSLAIMDEAVETQFMYPEMQAYAALLRQQGRDVAVVSPQDIIRRENALYVKDKMIQGLYNRHTDFYLESAALAHIRHALLAGQVELNPYPRSYALLGNKSRMADWWKDGLLESCLPSDDVMLIRDVVPEVRLLKDYSLEQAWLERKQWVFKPMASHAGKGVVLGKSMSRKRFAQLDRENTVMQRFIPASVVEHDAISYKFDIRLFMCGASLVAIAGRLWRGQITNFREEGSGWTSIDIHSPRMNQHSSGKP